MDERFEPNSPFQNPFGKIASETMICRLILGCDRGLYENYQGQLSGG